jgi:putative inorganic carbon (hco3(-)) transporter
MVPDIGGSRFVGEELGTTGAATLVPSRQRKLSKHKQLGEAYISLLLFMVVYCARPEDWIPGLSKVPLAKIAGILALAAFGLSVSQIRQRLPREVIFLILLTGQLFVTVPMASVWRGGALSTTLDFAKIVLIVLVMVMAVNTAPRLRQLLFVQAASVAAISAVAVWKGRELTGRLEGVLNGNYSNSNDLAVSIVISLPLCLALLFLTKKPIWKAAWALAIVIMAYATLLTGSRAGFISLAIAASVCLWEFAVRGRRPYLFALAAVLGVVLLVSSASMLGERLKETFSADDPSSSTAYASSQQRAQLLWRSIELTAKHPLFGVGPGNFTIISGSWHVTHNSYTQISSEGGIPALIFYVAILGYGFKNLKRIRQFSSRNREVKLWAGALRASLAGFVVGSFFASYAYQFFPYFLVIYTTVLLRIAKQSIDGQEPPPSTVQTQPEHVRRATIESKLIWHRAEV